MPRYKLSVAYDGTGFHGWQEQNPPDGEPLRTVQAELRRAAQVALKQPIVVQGASRTDSGVHALGQVAQFDAETRIPIDRIPKAINSKLPPDVEVRDACEVASGFDCISDAVNKQYRYRIWTSEHRPLMYRHVVHHYFKELDVQRMSLMATRIIGEHDFESFATSNHGRLTTVRRVFDCRVEREPSGRPEVHLVISGNGFLYNMVRIIAGTLVECGRGHWEPEHVDEIIAAKDRRAAGPTLPPQGLCLEWIKYPDA